MSTILHPWHLFVVILAGWVNRRQQDAIDYLRTENQILRKACGKKRIPLTNAQRRRLAIKGKLLGRKLLGDIATIVTPDTILRWHHRLVAMKWDYSRRRSKAGRPPVSKEVIDMVLRLARENRSWGFDRIQGALANLGIRISDTTVGNILQEHGIEPAPERLRRTSWNEFIKAHWNVLAAIDFTTVEVWTKGGLVTMYVLFVIEIRTRRVHFAGCTANPDAPWMKQVARNLTDCSDGFLLGRRFILMDRDGKFCDAFRSLLEVAGTKPVRLPARSPNLNAFIERFMRSLKSECLSRMIFFGENSLRDAVRQYLAHYHEERNHQGLGNRLIEPDFRAGENAGDIQCRERIGGLLKYYYRDAA